MVYWSRVIKMVDKKVILAVGAHPDDIEWGCGGTLKLHKNAGNEVYALVLTDGECNQDQRVIESKEAGEILGLDEVFFPHLPIDELSDNRANIYLIEEYIKKIDPQIIYTTPKNDRHQDHRYCALATLSAARKVPNIFIYETGSNILFTPHMYVDISETMNEKIDALSKHKTQIDRGSIQLSDVYALAKYRASQLSKINKTLEYAEAFEIYRILSYPKTGGMEI